MTPDPDKLAQNPWDGLRPPAGALRARRFAAKLGGVTARIGQAGHAAAAFAEARAQRRGGLTGRILALLERLLGRRAGKERNVPGKRLLRFLRLRRAVSLSSMPLQGRVSAAGRPTRGAMPIVISRFLPGSVTQETIYSAALRTRLVHLHGRDPQWEAERPGAAWPGAAPPLPVRLFTPGPVARRLSAARSFPGFATEIVRRSEADAATRGSGSPRQALEPFWRERAPRMETQPLSRPPVPQASWLGVSPSAPLPAERLPLARTRSAESFLPPASLSAAPPPATLPRPSFVTLPEMVYGTRAFTARPLSNLASSNLASAGAGSAPPAPQKQDAPRRPPFPFATRLLATAAAFSFVQALPSLQPAPARAAGAPAVPSRVDAGAFVRPDRLAGPVAVTGLMEIRAEGHAGTRPALLALDLIGSRGMTKASGGLRRRQASPRQISPRQISPEPATRLPVNAAPGLAQALPSLHHVRANAASVPAAAFTAPLRPDAPALARPFSLRGPAPTVAGRTGTPAAQPGADDPAPGRLPRIGLMPGAQVSSPGADARTVPRVQAIRLPLLPSSAVVALPTLLSTSRDMAPASPGREPEEKNPEAGTRNTARPFQRIPVPPLPVPPQRAASGLADASRAARLPLRLRTTLAPEAERPASHLDMPDTATIRPDASRIPPRRLTLGTWIGRTVSDPGVSFTVTHQVLGRLAVRFPAPAQNPPPRQNPRPRGGAGALPPSAAPGQTHTGLPERPRQLPQIALRRAARAETLGDAQPSSPMGGVAAEPGIFEEAVVAEFQPPLLALVRGFLSDFLSGFQETATGQSARGAAVSPVPAALVRGGTDQKSVDEDLPTETAHGLAPRLPAARRAVPPPFDLPPLGAPPERDKAWTPGTPARAALPSSAPGGSRVLRGALTPWTHPADPVGRLLPDRHSPEHPANGGTGGMALTEAMASRQSVALADAPKALTSKASALRPPRAPAMALPLPTAPVPADEGWAIQRVASGSPSAGGAEAKSPQQDINLVAEEKGAAANDVHLLANEVWSLLKRRLETEAERTGRR